ncbi:MAG: RNA polymerase sigma factor [Patescibacteria group bacterium]|nr:RNA polymerase sigma factor [Patescibacteria group bacterium]MDE2218566.1 RNA polymerase sigma factor [Patescibacteria group bacterium]
MAQDDLEKIKELFGKAKKGDKEYFSEICEVYFKPLHRYVYLRIGNKAESDELLQDIFIKAFDSVENSPQCDSLTVFHFYDVARKSVMDWKRKRKRVALSDESMENYSDGKASNTDEISNRKEFNNFREALKELSDEQQDAIIFKFIDGLSNEDIGSILGVSARSALRLEAQGLIFIRDNLKMRYERQF